MKKLAILVLVVLSGCGTIPTPKTSAQVVFEAQTAYKIAKTTEVWYAQQPRCPNTTVVVCSDKNTVKQVKDIDIAAWGVIQASQRTVRTKGFGENTLQSAAIAAMNAANAFVSVTDQLKGH